MTNLDPPHPCPGTDNDLDDYIKIPLIKGCHKVDEHVEAYFNSKPVKTSRLFTKKELTDLAYKWMENPQLSSECANDLFNLIGSNTCNDNNKP